jgi:SAM-dependent methyltransferase
MVGRYNKKRVNPPIWQHDYHVLKRLHSGLFSLAQKYLRQQSVILDYGCGTSPYKELFLPYTARYIKADLVDNEEADIKFGKNEHLPLKDKSIDIVISTQVLEHVQRVTFYLQECKRLLKKDGILLLSTHGIWPYHPYPTDYHRWTRAGLEKTLADAGFICLIMTSVLGPFASVTQFTLLLIAERLTGKNVFSKILLIVFSVVGNCIIWLEDRLFPAEKESDAALYIVCARKI